MRRSVSLIKEILLIKVNSLPYTFCAERTVLSKYNALYCNVVFISSLSLSPSHGRTLLKCIFENLLVTKISLLRFFAMSDEGGLEYADCIPCWGIRLLSKGVSKVWHKLIWWLSSRSGTLMCMEYSFTAVTPRFTLRSSNGKGPSYRQN